MKYYARFNDTDFCISQLPSLKDSSKETKFSDIEINFTGYDEILLPIQYQEIQIIQIDENLIETVLMIAYCEGVDYPEFEYADQPFLITINLLSPYAYASKRSVSTQIDSISLNVAILSILAPLIADGFTVEENNLSEELVSEIFQNETVEKTMNYLASKFNFVWYIDKEKKIYLKDINILIGQEAVISITESNKCFLQKIKPTKTVVDYANRLNIKNAIKIEALELLPVGTDLNPSESYMFAYPISVSGNTCYRLSKWDDLDPLNETFVFLMSTELGSNSYAITVDLDAKTITYDSTIGISGIDDDSGKKILMIMDAVDNTKILGFKWNSATETTGTAISAVSYSALIPYQTTYIDPVEIAKIKDKTNTSGVIEKIVDANGKYFTTSEIQSYAVSLFSQNNVQTNEIECTFKGRLNNTAFITILNSLKITKVFSANLPTFKIDDKFIITDTYYSANTETATLKVNARNYNLNENYLDIYRVSMPQETEDSLTRKLVVFYNQDNKTVLNKEIYINGELVNSDV